MERLTEHYGDYIKIKGNSSLYGNHFRSKAYLCNAIVRLAAYEDTNLTPEEIISALDSAEKLIATMRNNKKAALWLKKYGKGERS